MSAFTRRFLVLAALALAGACFVSPVSASAPRPEKVTITLNRRNVYFLDGRQVTRDRIEPLLAARVRKNLSVVAVIQAGPHQTVGRVSQLMDLVKQSGVQSVMIATTNPMTHHVRRVH